MSRVPSLVSNAFHIKPIVRDIFLSDDFLPANPAQFSLLLSVLRTDMPIKTLDSMSPIAIPLLQFLIMIP